MKARTGFLMIALAFLLLAAGSAGAQTTYPAPPLLPGAWIPQFVDPLPGLVPDGTLGGITVISGTTEYTINLEEFQANILPVNAAIPPDAVTGFPGLAAAQPSWVWGYLTDNDKTLLPGGNGIRPSYLGPAVLASRGIATYPTYINNLPSASDGGHVQGLLPIDQTLDWADPLYTACVGADPGARPECAYVYNDPQPAVPHIHGGEVAPAYDGGPDAWWTPGVAQQGAGFVGTTFTYPNDQQAGTIWFHDHALGITRLNVYAGMAGVHIITDPANEPPTQPDTGACPTSAFGGCLPNGAYDIPLIIQDRSFDWSGQLYYNLASNPQPNPGVHPYWIPEFIGDVIVVNGRAWPFLNVEPRKYRFRLLNGSNARFYDLTLNNLAVPSAIVLPPRAPKKAAGATVGAGLPFSVIATDDGYLNAPVPTSNVIIGPGERYEIIVDFTGLAVGTEVIMKNSARTPFPGGAKPVAGTTDRVMKFKVIALTGIPDAPLPTNLRPNNPILNIKTQAVANRPVAGACPVVTPTVPYPAVNTIVRQLTLNEIIGAGGPLELVVNNTKYNGGDPLKGSTTWSEFGRRDSEQPAVGDTEIWEIINITADAHPIHTHLASFQILNRQAISATPWMTLYAAQLATAYGPPPLSDGAGPPNTYLNQNADCAIGGNPPIGPYLKGNPKNPLPYELGWKDTAIMYPGEVTRIVIRWAATDAALTTVAGDLTYPFEPYEIAGGVGYVWHCHIIDHEDNEMMRPYIVNTTRQDVKSVQ